HLDAYIILGMIGALMLTLLLSNAFVAVTRAYELESGHMVSRGIALTLRGISFDTAFRLHRVMWWMHALLVLAFLNYLPYSKHLHVASSLFNVFFSNTSWNGERAVMRPMDLEADVEKFGAADVEDLTWKNLLDGYSCTECGRCTAACPANLTGKLLSPRKIVVNARQRLMEKGPLVTGDRMEFL